MTEDQEKASWEQTKVIVSHGCVSDDSKCMGRGCKRHDKYLIFVGNSCRLSTLSFRSCKKHLPLFIDKALEERNQTCFKQIANAKKREIEEAKKLLKIDKE